LLGANRKLKSSRQTAEEIQLLYFDWCAELCDFISADWMWIKAAASGENRSKQKCFVAGCMMIQWEDMRRGK